MGALDIRLPEKLLIALCLLSAASATVQAGTVRATVESEEPIQSAWLVERKLTNVGVYDGRRLTARIAGTNLVVENVPVGRYDLRLKTAGGEIWGWDAAVPPSDYEEELPLSEESRQTILNKLKASFATGFDDRAVVLDMQGNIQNATVLVTQLRTTPFTGGGYREGEWVWRVTRWEWRCPEDTWAPRVDRPYYAMVRERLYPKDYEGKHLLLARHLGGIEVAQADADVNLGIISLPAPKKGIHAIGPDGSLIEPIVLKPQP